MEDKKEPTQGHKPQPKLVPESDLLAVKKSMKSELDKAKEELAKIRTQLAETQAELEMANTDVDDTDAEKQIKAYLLGERKKLEQEKAEVEKGKVKYQEDLAAFQEREKESRVKTLASEHGVELDAIKDAEDPEKEALRLKAERLTKEKEAIEKKTPESSFETAQTGIVKKQPQDMSTVSKEGQPSEFDQFWERQKKEALSVK